MGLSWAGALLRLGDHSLPKRIVSGELKNAGQHGPGVKEKEWTECAAEDRRVFHITGESTAARETLGLRVTQNAKGVALWPRG